MKTVEELLMPRYKVIAIDTSEAFKVGEILNHPPDYHDFIWTTPTGTCIFYPEKYPHLFQPLPWYAERDVSDMPEYVKLNPENTVGGNTVFRVVEAKKYNDGIGIAVEPSMYPEVDAIENRLAHTDAKYFLPATREEYEAYQQKNK